VAAGLLERNAKKSGKAETTEEPMAAWERELLEQHEAAKTEESAEEAK
jgi:30S ribosomal protein S2